MENENENEIKTYSQKLETLSLILNNRLNKESVLSFKQTLTDLKNQNETTLSIKFLKNLFNGVNHRTINNTLNQLIKRNELKTQSQFRFYKFFDNMGNTIKTKETLRFIIV